MKVEWGIGVGTLMGERDLGKLGGGGLRRLGEGTGRLGEGTGYMRVSPTCRGGSVVLVVGGEA